MEIFDQEGVPILGHGIFVFLDQFWDNLALGVIDFSLDLENR